MQLAGDVGVVFGLIVFVYFLGCLAPITYTSDNKRRLAAAHVQRECFTTRKAKGGVEGFVVVKPSVLEPRGRKRSPLGFLRFLGNRESPVVGLVGLGKRQ